MTRITNTRIEERFGATRITKEWTSASCSGKEAFDTPQMASHVARKRRIKSQHYRCRCCGRYHIRAVT